MGPVATSVIIFLCIFAAALGGAVVRPWLPQHHVSSESKDLLKQGLTIVGTMTALVLGLLVASAKSSFDEESAEVTKVTANIVVLDRILAHDGPKANGARGTLHDLTAGLIAMAWGNREPLKATEGSVNAERLVAAIQGLPALDENQRQAKEWAVKILIQVATSRWMVAAEQVSPMPKPFLVIVVLWLTLIFFGMGLMSPANGTTLVVLLASAVATAGALFLVLELYDPFHGLMRVSPAPLQMALGQLGR
jgi:hypothetical protein